MNLPARSPAAPSAGDIIALISVFGWEGAWIIWLGVLHGVWVECLAGLVITVLLWRPIGMALLERRRAANVPAVAL
jgi:hypothetical protein